MAVASGVFKQVAYKVETNYGVAAGASGGTAMRRISSTIDLSKEVYRSEEIESHQQMADARHGTRRVGGTITGHLAPGSYKTFFELLCRKDFAAVSALTGLSLTIAASGQNWTVTRATGDFITGGLKIFDVIRISAGTVNAANLNKNLLIVGMTGTVLTVAVLNRSALVAEGPIASCTISLPGKKTMMAVSGHTDKSLSIEHWYSDIGESELFVGCKPTAASLSLPPTGNTRAEFQIGGYDIQTAQARYFTSPSAASTAGITAAVNGYLLVHGSQLVTATGMSININGNFSGDPVVGDNRIPSQDPGRMLASGQLTAKFDTVALRNAFIDETEGPVAMVITSSNAANADFMTLVMPRTKIGGANKDDGEKAIVQTLPFEALLNLAGGAGQTSDQTTLSMQDSQA